ncbi:hypothetical protein QNH23_01165 [Siminovitchia fortis]|uniref:Diacylglycerol glucosyltransferase N-terminal domain-containing protein n=1 Tax=Siminovitchia fortis TaxID=254758 RepID=A0A451GCP2_9BACI|nr:hypothetical protein [Siminovitchia fortis]RWR13149.1 hypothetical protein D4N35_005085 [Siminovitchia fortis]WHY82069.1 hypothetical protein QNH23_01165 [Siminovitchia fortis]
MHNILFLPFLQIPSGHHHVADSIKNQLEQMADHFHCEKIDILSYGYGNIESLISSIYLQWIHKLPKVYSTIYRLAAVERPTLNKRFRMYEVLFIKVFRNLLQEKKPDLVVCTHALPSYMIARLKKLQLWTGIAINVYTDYFINNLWGIDEIDYHFVPSKKIKDQLVEQGVNEKRIFITGIPVHPIFSMENHMVKKERIFTALISGGNMGAGSIFQLLNRLKPGGQILYKVLCGKNDKLLQHIRSLNHPLIQPIPYISSKEKMNRLYDETDMIITKPGGVTISESLTKKLPIFVYDVLPGQEEQNLNFLQEKGLVHHLDKWTIQENIEEDILNVLHHKRQETINSIHQYLMEVELEDPVSFIIDTFGR